MKKKTILFADEDIVVSHIDSVQAYILGGKGYIVVKTISREYVEEFMEPHFSSLINQEVPIKTVLQNQEVEHNCELIDKHAREMCDASIRLTHKILARKKEIMKIL